MKRLAILLAFLVLSAWPAHMGLPARGPEGLRLVQDEAHAARFGGGRSFGFRGSRGFSRRSFATPRSPLGQQQAGPGFRRGFGGLGGGLFGGLGGLLLGGFIGSMLFGRGFGGIGLLEILLIGGGIFFLMRMLGRGRAGAPRHGGRPAYAPGDPYGVGGHEPSSGGAESRAARLVYTGPDIGAKGSGRPSLPPGAGMPSGPAGGAVRSDLGLEAGLRAIAASDPSFSKENFFLDARRNFTRFQEAWVARDLNPIREMVDRDIYEKCQGDLDGLRREGRINRLDDIRIRALDLVEAWQEEGFDFVTVRVEASLLDYVVAETSGEVVGGSRTEPVAFTEVWTWARKSGRNPWFLSAIEQG